MSRLVITKELGQGFGMTSEQPSIKRVFTGIWRIINGARIVVLNLVFFLILFFILGALFAGSETLVVQPNTALLLQPTGRVVEEYTQTPLDHALQKASEGRLMETRLRDVVGSIRRAKNDSRITVLVIDPSLMSGIGLASLQEIEEAVQEFRDSGKPVIAVADVMSQQQYYLAALADEIWLDPEGLVWIDGFAIYRHYYRELLEKLSVEVNLFRAGEYKSAGEPYIRDDMSPQAREANLYWMGSLWQHYLEGISRHRGIPLEDISDGIQAFPERLAAADGDFAVLARDLGLVDRLISRPEAYQELASRSAPASDELGFRNVGIDDYLLATSLQDVRVDGDKVAIVVAQGEIIQGQAERGYVAAESTVEKMHSLSRRQDVAAVVLRIDSPGGDAFASEKIRREAQALRDAGKTVVVSMGNVAASGGYWIAMAADEVWASPSSITGSIGVFGLAPRIHQSLERIGVHTDGVGTTPLAGQFDITLPLDPQLEQIYRTTVDKIYEDFIGIVSEARNMSGNAVRDVARGRVWSGSQALERGLVDHLGTLQQAIDSAGRIAGLGSDFRVEYEESELSAFELFLLELAGGVMARTTVFSEWNQYPAIRMLGNVQQELGFIARTRGQLTVASHCLCSMQ
jgi:protease-4